MNSEVAVHQLVAWAKNVEIVEPPELRDLVVRRARDVIAQYASV